MCRSGCWHWVNSLKDIVVAADFQIRSVGEITVDRQLEELRNGQRCAEFRPDVAGRMEQADQKFVRLAGSLKFHWLPCEEVSSGSNTENVVPLGDVSVSSIRPSLRSRISRQTNKPSPVPVSFVVKYG